MYVCYDLKGIQRFIFSVPKLKCVVGASGMIDRFDRESRHYATAAGGQWIFSGGGRGAFSCPDHQSAEHLERQLVSAAHAIGLDIRIGIEPSLSQAAHHADRLHAFCPENLDGQPCSASGLWPTPSGRPHPLVQLRYASAREDYLGQRILHALGQEDQLQKTLAQYSLAFFKNVNPQPDGDELEDSRDVEEAEAAQRSLGKRNRWAIIAMDGNDMGRQFQAFESQQHPDGQREDRTRQWLSTMSQRLRECTEQAFLSALTSVICQWAENVVDWEDCVVGPMAGGKKPTLMLPFRPLILGGDDVILLCHTAYAMSFVKKMAQEFQQQSKQAAASSAIQPLWPATGDQLTISAGVLYAKVTFPLHSGIRYAESLLASAKGRFRADPNTTQPTSAAVDWDTVTDSLVDTPAARRNRELRFHDPELDREIQLTRRPYLLNAESDGADLQSLEEWKAQLARVPRSVRATLLPGLQQPWSKRVAFTASVAKGHAFLWDQLREDSHELGEAWSRLNEKDVQVTGLPDALLLLDEEHRLSQAEDYE